MTEFEQSSPSGRWSVRDLFLFAAFVVFTVLFLPRDLSPLGQVVSQGVLDIVWVAFLVVLVRVLQRRSFGEAIHWFKHQFQLRYLIALGAALALGVLLLSSLFPAAEPPPIEKLFTSGVSLYIFAILGVGVAPVVEEIIFRGFVFGVASEVGNMKIAVPVTAVLFGLIHVPQLWGSWAAILLIFGMGYVLSVIRARSNSLIPSVIVHTSYNGMIFLLALVGSLSGANK